MRIISGAQKGRRITAPKNLPVRPTTDMAKEALFNILNNHYYFDGISVIDLFAGTGNISYEFASRGCTDITAVDAHYGCIKFIDHTAKQFNFDIMALKSNVFSYLEKTAQQAHVIFADPPYDFTTEQFLQIANTVFDRALLLEGGMLIIEHSQHTDLSEHSNYSHSKKYGGNMFSFFEYEDEEE